MEVIKDIDFINGSIIETFGTKIDNEKGTTEYYFEIKKGEETRKYTPIEYINLILDKHYSEADKTKNYRKQLNCIVNAESAIRRKIIEFDLKNKGFDFSAIIEDLLITEKRITAYSAYKEKWGWFIRGVIVSMTTALIGAIPTIIEKSRPLPLIQHIEFPKVVQIHDTIYLHH